MLCALCNLRFYVIHAGILCLTKLKGKLDCLMKIPAIAIYVILICSFLLKSVSLLVHADGTLIDYHLILSLGGCALGLGFGVLNSSFIFSLAGGCAGYFFGVLYAHNVKHHQIRRCGALSIVDNIHVEGKAHRRVFCVGGWKNPLCMPLILSEDMYSPCGIVTLNCLNYLITG